ncbi:MAG: hypothetical protein ACM3XZ_04730 [Betaproteobacteria bacterium]
MGELPELIGLPLAEAQERLRQGGLQSQVRRTGELGREWVRRRAEREGLVENGERVVRVRLAGGEVELVVATTFQRRPT